MGFAGIYIYIFIYSLVGGKTTPLKNISQLG